MIAVRVMVLVEFMYVLQYSKKGMEWFWRLYNSVLLLLLLAFVVVSERRLGEPGYYTRAGRLISLTESVNLTCLLVH